MATTRLFRTSKPSRYVLSSSTCPSSSAKTVRCLGKAGFNGETRVLCGNGDQRKSAVPVKASVATSKSLTIITKPDADRGLIDLAALLENVTAALLKVSRQVVKRRTWKLQIQMVIERVRFILYKMDLFCRNTS